MGYCIDGDDQVDIFISYARVDDERNNDWITDFERYLEKMLRSEIQGSLDEAAEPDRVKKLVVCRDEKNFPSSGDLPEIIHQLVSQSQFLFIFIGSGYLRYDWCLQELDYFRNTSGGTLDLSRVYLIVVDEKAIEALEEETIPAALNLDLTRQRLWQELQKVTNRGIRQHGFLENGAPIPVWQSEDRARNEFHDVARRLVEEVAGKLLKRRSSLRPAPATPKPAPAVPV